jgi:hypothetical protein
LLGTTSGTFSLSCCMYGELEQTCSYSQYLAGNT